MRNKFLHPILYTAFCTLLLSGCSKLLDVNPPIDSITTEELFSDNKQAEWAVASIYSKMINGLSTDPYDLSFITERVFSAGLSTIMGGLSADELTAPANLASTDFNAMNNKLSLLNSSKTAEIWYSAYRIIFDANAAIDGIEGSTSLMLTDSARRHLTGETLALRAFCYFYLVNFYGDVPLALSSDFKKTLGLPRSPVAKVYDQIKADLVKAKALLGSDYSAGKNERVRVNRWFAEAMLARVYLYTGEYEQAINSATEVINHTALFGIEPDLTQVFKPNNREVIFQLKPASENIYSINGTPEGYALYRVPPANSPYLRSYEVSDQLIGAFEANDKRKETWLAPVGTAFVAAKYFNGKYSQYYNVMRLAELHLIRAEATVRFTPGAKNNAIEDLNILRRRAEVSELDDQLTAEQVITAIAHERRIELFVEWGHRWLDLKRTSKAQEILSAVPNKQPWLGNYQLVYPIPPSEIRENSKLQQNAQYDNQ